jgi:flagellar protein FlgJ
VSVLSATAGSAGSAGSANAGLALDSRALESLRQSSEIDPEGSVRKAAGQFEALFMQQLLKSMRAAIPKSGMFEGPGSDMYTGMLDSQLTQAMGNTPGGLADIIARQMTRHMKALQPGAGAPDAGSAAGAGTSPAGATGAVASAGSAGADSAGVPATPAADAARASAAAYGRNSLEDAHALQESLQGSLSRRLSPTQAGFVESMWPHAVAAQEQTGLPAAYVVGQAALESGWGKRDIRDADGNPSHNLFGIKATGGWQGKTVAVLTTEYVDGKPRKVVEEFRRYDSFAEAFTDWARLMNRSTRYAEVLKAGSAADFARGLGEAGYATDPRYSEKLERTINQTLMLKRLAM